MDTELTLHFADLENRISDLSDKVNKLYALSFPNDVESKNSEDVKAELAKGVLDCFDFEKVAKVMKSLNWAWLGKGVPTCFDLKDEARKMFLDAWVELEDKPFDSNDSRELTISTGGLEVFVQEWRDENDQTKFFCSLKFILEEMTNSNE